MGVVAVAVLAVACGSSHTGTRGGSTAHSSSTTSLPVAATGAPCAPAADPEPLSDVPSGPHGPADPVDAAVLATTSSTAPGSPSDPASDSASDPTSDSDAPSGFATLAGADLLRHPLWAYAPTGPIADFADDAESGIGDDGAVDYRAFAGRLLLGDQLLDRMSGQSLATYPAAPLAVAPDCRAAVASDGSLSVYDGTGRQVWQAEVGASSPSASFVGRDASLLFVGDQQDVSVYDAGTGARRWSVPTGGAGYFSTGDDVVLTGAGSTTFYDAATGAPALSVPERTAKALSAVTLVCATSTGAGSLGGQCTVIGTTGPAARTGATVTEVANAWDVGSSGAYLVADRQDRLSYFPAATATKPAWTTAGPAGQLPTNDDGEPWPVADGHLILALGSADSGSDAGSVVAVSTASGAIAWDTPLPDSSGSPSLWVDGPAHQAVAYPRQYVGAGNPTVGVDLATGAVAWSSPSTVIGLTSAVTPLVVGDQVVGLDTVTGRAVWTVPRPASGG